MSKPTEIIPGRGLGDLLFGSTFQEVRAVLGDPDDIGRSEFDDDDTGEISISEMWTWGTAGISAHFDEEDDFRCGMFSANGKEYTFEGMSLIGRKEKDVLAMIESLNMGPMDEEEVIFEDNDEAPEGKMISFPDKEIEFWFENGTLTEIQWSPFWADDDTRIWPEL